jgi:hypothetical protein
MSKPRTDITNWPKFDYCLSEEFEDAKGVIRIRILKKNRQHNDQKKKYKGTNNDLQNIHIKLKIESHEPHKKPGVNSGAP